MVSVCSVCKGLQIHLRAGDGEQQQPDAESTEPLRWLNTTLPNLRRSSTAGCRACALLLHGILLHHDRFADAREESVRISAESFPTPAKSEPDGQDHLSVSVRWKSQDDDTIIDDNDDLEPEGYPDLKLEFFTDSGML